MRKLPKNLPNHIAFIMDGNRRWAVHRGLNKFVGHQVGAQVLVQTIKTVAKIDKIKCVSFFAFSTENWKREQKEIDAIFELAKNIFKENEEYFIKDNIKVIASGDVTKMPQDIQDIITKVSEETKNNTGLLVNMAINYGGQDDILHAVNHLLSKGKKNINKQDFEEYLYTFPAPAVDFVVRTSGELRLSNYMMYQMAFSELYFTKVCWPSFNHRQLYKALKNYSKRNRRLGGN